jgi:hypothetical protein
MNPLSSSSSATASTGDSLIGSLCREIAGLRVRALQLAADLGRRPGGELAGRLRRELRQLERRRCELLATARMLGGRGLRDRLSLELLVEITSRPLVA